MLALASGCGGGAAGSDADVDVEAALEAFDSSPRKRDRSFARLNLALAAERAATREAALVRLESADPNVRLGAVYALGLSLEPGDADRLAPFLEAADEAERVLAATALVSLGDARGVPVLIATLDSAEPLPFAVPVPAGEQAAFALRRFTGVDHGLDRAAWETWWADAEKGFEPALPRDRFAS